MIGDFIIGLILVYGYFAWVEPRLKTRLEWLRERVIGQRALIAGKDLAILREAICTEVRQRDMHWSAEVYRARAEMQRAEDQAKQATERLLEAHARIKELQEEAKASQVSQASRQVVLAVRREVRQRLHPDRFESARREAANRAFQECEAVFREMLG